MSNWKVSFFPALLLAVALLLPTAVSAQQVQVTSATPPEAPQGTISLDVTVAGSGFDSSAQVEFLLTGTTNPGGITVRKVKVTGPKKLIATIDVADTATVSKFDIQVVLSGGRKGKGTSLFAVISKASNDPCAAPGIDFPAFTFIGAGESIEEQIYLADSSGTCIRPLHKTNNGYSATHLGTVFSYPVAGTSDVGRIVWHYARYIYGLSFLVTGTSITPYSVELIHDRGEATLTSVDLSKDGTTVFAATDAGDNESSHILAINFDDHSYRTVYSGPADSTDIRSVSVDDSGALFVQQVVPIGDSDDFSQILIINPDCDNPTCSTIVTTDGVSDSNSVGGTAASLVDDRFVYEHSGITPCSPVLQVMSIAGGPVLNAAYPFYGRRSSWYDGKILTNGFKVNKRGCSISGTISEFDPDTGAEKILVRGFDPDGR